MVVTCESEGRGLFLRSLNLGQRSSRRDTGGQGCQPGGGPRRELGTQGTSENTVSCVTVRHLPVVATVVPAQLLLAAVHWPGLAARQVTAGH